MLAMSDKVPMTPEGHQHLRDEVKRLKEVELPAVIKDIATAREHGDLKENAEWHAARERQGMIIARIAHIEQSLNRAEVIDPTKIKSDKVVIRVLHKGVGSVTNGDIHLACASEAIILAFNVSTEPTARFLAEEEAVDIRTYQVIYALLEDVEKGDVGGELGLEIVLIHRAELDPVKGRDIGEVVFEMGLDLVVFQWEFSVFLADVELREDAGDVDVRDDACQLGAFA